MNTDDYRIIPLRRDRDAILLVAISAAALLITLGALAFLPDEAWDRLSDRSHALYVAGASVIPAVIAGWRRYKLREEAVKALSWASTKGGE